MRRRVREPDKPLILVVDDDRTVRLMLRYALEADGYTVIEAKDGARALSEYERLQPDIVLMDAVMPVMDGLTACSRLRELPGGSRTPVLIITALEDEKLVDLAFKSGAADFITKPIHLEALRHRVRRLLRAKQTEVLLEQSEAGAQSVISSALDGIITVNDNGLIQSFNPAAERIFGYTAEEAIGKHVKELMPGAYRQRDGHLPAGQDAAQKKVKSVSREISGRRKDGSAIPLEVTISGFYTGEQRLITVRDITERKQAEEKLRLAAKVFESVAEGIMVTDTEGTIQSVNPAFTTITGYSEEEVVGKNPRLFESGQPGDERYQNVWASLRETGQWQGEIRAWRKNGEMYPAWASVNVIKDEQGRGTQYVMVFFDVTERVRLQEERQRVQEQTVRLQRLASLSAMSAGIAHEINQPLNAIKVLADGLLYWHSKGHRLEPAKVIESLKRISAQAGRIDEIIKHVRSFATVGRHAAELAPCNLNDAVNGALSILGRQLSAHGIVVKKALADDLPKVLGNANRLEEVVINLLVNAMQALDTVSRTEKEISCVTRLGKFGGGGGVILEIADNGSGISDELKERIFEPFFSTKKTGKGMGMGLGLAIVQSVITGYNGQIEVFNNENGGATFRVELPAIENGANKR